MCENCRHDYFTKRGVSCLYGYHVYQFNVGSTKYEAYNEKNHHLEAVCLHGVSRMQSLDLILTS